MSFVNKCFTTGDLFFILFFTYALVVECIKPKTQVIKDQTGRTVHTLIGHEKEVTCLEVSDNIIFSGSDDRTIRIWDQNGSLQKTLSGHKETVTCLQVIGKTIISGSDDKTICIWDQTLDLPLQTLSGHEGSVTCLKATDTTVISGLMIQQFASGIVRLVLYSILL